MNNFKYNESGLHLTEQFEGCSLVAYQKEMGGKIDVWTIGYGHTGGNVHAGLTCTKQQAEDWLAQDIAWAGSVVNRAVKVALTQNEFNALVDFTFNCGCGAFEKSTMLAKLNSGDYKGAADEFENWDKSGGKVVAGLLRRRIAEKAEFMES